LRDKVDELVRDQQVDLDAWLTTLALPGAFERNPTWLQPAKKAGKYTERKTQIDQVGTLRQ
jgi:hypothetical protein